MGIKELENDSDIILYYALSEIGKGNSSFDRLAIIKNTLPAERFNPAIRFLLDHNTPKYIERQGADWFRLTPDGIRLANDNGFAGRKLKEEKEKEVSASRESKEEERKERADIKVVAETKLIDWRIKTYWYLVAVAVISLLVNILGIIQKTNSPNLQSSKVLTQPKVDTIYISATQLQQADTTKKGTLK